VASRKKDSGGLWRRRSPGPADLAGEIKKLRGQLDKAEKKQHALAVEPRPFRFRHQTAPLGWLALMASGLACRGIHAHAWPALIAALLAPLIAVAFTRHRGDWHKLQVRLSAIWAALWLVILYAEGGGWWLAPAVLGWYAPYALWLRRYAWRPGSAEPARPEPLAVQWARLCAAMKWDAELDAAVEIPNGKRYTVTCDGITTPFYKIAQEPRRLASAFGKRLTEMYPEADRTGLEHTGTITLLKSGTLDAPRPWRGGTISADGVAVTGRFPDGEDVHERWFNLPFDGIVHCGAFGAPGSGKTGCLDLGMAISVSSGLVTPVVLDPQEGQAMPAWQEHVRYATGTDQCMAWLLGLNDAMYARSRFLSQALWCREHGTALVPRQCERCRKPRRGMGFFNPWLSGLPVIEITLDEAPVLLAIPGAVAKVLDMLKLGRKAGFRFRLAAQVPSLSELGDQALRSMLVAGCIYCFRTGDKVTGGMANLAASPHLLPKYFPDRSATNGLGYAEGLDGRGSVQMRTDYLTDAYETAESLAYRDWDDTVGGAFSQSLADAGHLADRLRKMADDEAAAQLAVLGLLDKGPLPMGDIITRMDGIRLSEVTAAVNKLQADGKLERDGDLIGVAG